MKTVTPAHLCHEKYCNFSGDNAMSLMTEPKTTKPKIPTAMAQWRALATAE
jgi:hypothetical protein